MPQVKKDIPPYIRAAQDALTSDAVKAHPDYEHLRKALPVYAHKLHQAGRDVDTDSLMQDAIQGADYLKQVCQKIDGSKTLKYEDIAASFPDDRDEKIIRFTAACRAGDVEQVRLIASEFDDISAVVNSGLFNGLQSGCLDVVKYLVESGANIRTQNNYAICLAVKLGYLDIVKYLHQKDSSIIASNDDTAYFAAAKGHLDVLAYLLEQNASVNAALQAVARFGNLRSLRYLIKQGVDIHAGYFMLVRHAAGWGRLNVIKYLAEHKLMNFLAAEQALGVAAQNGYGDIVLYLIGLGYNPDVLKKIDLTCLRHSQKWAERTGTKIPKALHAYDPGYFVVPGLQDCLTEIVNVFQYEVGGLGDEIRNEEIGIGAAALFHDWQTLLRYLKKYGAASKAPLFDVINNIQLPPYDPKIEIGWKSWRSAVMQHGPKMGFLFRYANHLPCPIRSQDGKNWNYQAMVSKLAKYAYKRGAENPNLAALFLRHSMSEDAFEQGQDLIEQYRQRYGAEHASKKGALPDIAFTLPNGLRYQKLPDGDMRGMILGQLTDCCQTIGRDNGDACTKHGYLSKDSGFYVVVDKKGEIIGQSWAWLGKGSELVLDSLETLGTRVSKEDWESIATKFSKVVEKEAKHISGLYIGADGKTPKLSFNKLAEKHSPQPKDYDSYRDSKEQYRVWQRRAKPA